jgi:hypothetical protein
LDGDGNPPAPAPSAWPEDWRQRLAGEDAALLARMGRFANPNDIVKSWREAEKKISSGQVVDSTPFPATGTPEDQASWREAHGIPATPDKYEINLGEGMVLGEDDKPVVDNFLKAMHESNLPPKYANEALKWYWKYQDTAVQEQYNADAGQSEAGIQQLRDDWGPEYKANMNAIKGMLDSADTSFAEKIFHARGPDGQLLGNNPKIIQWLATTARTLNPAATLIPGDTTTSLLAVGDEITKIEKLMGNKHSEYWKGPGANKMQERYRQLVTARDRMK